MALTDVVGMDAFSANLDLYYAKLFDRLRHASSVPVVWGEKSLALDAKLTAFDSRRHRPLAALQCA